ncbi:MAG: protein kinase family protein [Myxococcota bacterium]|nr:protein kinase family protein [Myxococcota bacterium]
MFPETERLSGPVLLGRGALGRVYRAEDTVDGSVLAVRVLPPAAPWAKYRLQSGFSSLQSIDHQNLVRPTDLHDAGEPWFITMAHVDGPTLPEWIQQHAGPGAIQEGFGQLTRGLMALHRAGMLHRNLKPSNVRVDARGVVKILDSGLAGLLFDPHVASNAPTTRYEAPELRACPEQVSAAADWFSLGVLLREQLSDAEGPLTALCAALTHPDPTMRPDGPAVLAVLVAIPAWPPRRLVGHPIVERGACLVALERCWEQCQDGPVIALLSGRSGDGATTIAEHFLTRLAEDIPTITIHSHIPSRTPLGLVRRIVAALPVVPVAGLSPALRQVFPILRDQQEAPSNIAVPLDPRATRFQALDDLRALLVTATEASPLVLLLDDLHHADAVSAQVLADILTAAAPPRLLLLGTCPSESLSEAAFLQDWTELEEQAGPAGWLHRISVPPLSSAALHDCLRQQGLAAPEQRARIVSAAAGSPLFACSLLRTGLSNTKGMPQLTHRQLLTRHIATRSTRQQRILEVLAAAQQALPSEMLTEILGEDSRDDLAMLHSDGLITAPPDISLAHERVCDAVQARAAPMLYHRSIAQALIEHEPSEPVRIYWHLLASGDPASAVPYAIAAADQAAASLQLEAAGTHYRLALAHLPASDIRRKRVVAAAAAVMVRLGLSREAAPLLEEIATRRGDDADWTRRAAEQWIAAGEHTRGLEMLQTLLERSGVRWPSGRTEQAVLLRLGMTRLRLLALPEGWDTGSTESAATHRMALCWTAALALWRVDPLRVQYLLMTGLQHALRAKAARQAARFGLLLYTARGSTPDRLSACQALARRIDQPELHALADWTTAATSHAGNPQRSIPSYRCARDRFEQDCPEAIWESAMTRIGLLDALWWSGRLELLRPMWQDNLKRARSLKDQSLWCAAALAGGRLALLEGRVGRARERVAQIRARPRPLAEHLHARLLGARCALYTGELDGIATEVEAIWRALDSASLFGLPALQLHALDLRAAALAALRSAHAAGIPPADAPSSRALSRAEGRVRKTLERSGRADMKALAGLHRGSILAAQGNRDGARGVLTSTRTMLESAGLTLHVALCTAAISHLSDAPDDTPLLKLGVLEPSALLQAYLPGVL